jgi:hypothetical protein
MQFVRQDIYTLPHNCHLRHYHSICLNLNISVVDPVSLNCVILYVIMIKQLKMQESPYMRGEALSISTTGLSCWLLLYFKKKYFNWHQFQAKSQYIQFIHIVIFNLLTALWSYSSTIPLIPNFRGDLVVSLNTMYNLAYQFLITRYTNYMSTAYVVPVG